MAATDDSIGADELLASAQRGDTAAFEELVAAYRKPLQAYCYRMLGSLQDAEDAVQETLLGVWRGLPGFEGRSSLRSWVYRIATNACLRLASRRRRVLAPDLGPARTSVHELGAPVDEPIWLEPYPDALVDPDTDPEARYAERESVELAFVAALQHLPAKQRAVLVLRDVLAMSGAEVAEALDTTVASVNSALQRARGSIDGRVPPRQRGELRKLGDDGRRRLVAAFVAAWERADVEAMIGLLAEDARLSMPPLPAWFLGRSDIGRFLAERVFTTRWRLVPVEANGQLAFAGYRVETEGGPYRVNEITVLTLVDGQIGEMTAFLDPAVHRRFGLAEELAANHPASR